MELTRYIKIIEDQFNISGVCASQRFKEDLGADSLDMVELITNIEDQADIEIPDAMEAENSWMVGDLFITIMLIVNYGE
jgi:acyl carrier protein